ncbi:transcriptional corepressor LEUNIG-like isoform X2 [Macadamia integrifolia]|nr:transcriptional corepressor LEUNIG-like isoform X2 [Macadamia integrifolia]XP_042520739.1 transcriptional corepressor LEUNIG-like isoform X2 [Macadamia integrifolia]XP_042520740.1 transcriptional corepressor LEUNIG-like isoform X2 [Macadamia integrifolia]XP_042520741.1 transcriptional corepressor LEUNIG-like isoform X2 [Macadamia integrifolia]XP_042520742.1 transcriptional corepressor LEUNIG-like isoform X2 [Macadamia integrifolia]
MMEDIDWEADKMLNFYIHDYMVKRKLYKAAQTFKKEANIPSKTAALDCPEGFLVDWWSLFYDKYFYRELQQCEMNQQRLGQLPIEIDVAKMPPAGMLAAQIGGGERLRHPLSKALPPNVRLANCEKMASYKSMVQSLGNVQQQACAETQQIFMRGGRQGVGLSRLHPSEPTLFGVPKAMIPITAPPEAELNKGIGSVPLSGWPLAGIDQIPPGLGRQVLKSHLQTPIQQYQMMAAQRQQELIAQSLTHTPTNLMSSLSGTSSNLDLRRLMLLKHGLNVNVEQRDGCVDSQRIISSSTNAVPKTSGDVPKYEGGRKRKELSYPVAASGTMARDTPGAYAESLMPPRDKISTPIALLQNYRTSRKLDTHGTDRTGLAETSGKEGRPDVAEGSSDANVESFLSHDTGIDDLRGTPFSTMLQSSTARNRMVPKGFSFGEVCTLSSKSKVLCCHFSSDGKLVASAGHSKKVIVWNLDAVDFKCSSEDHSLLITDVRFRRSSSILATSSYDRTVQIWDTNDLSHSLCKLIGHSEQVMSLDFHPKKMDLLCSCDGNNEIWLWNVNRHECTCKFKGGMTQVRFQPQVGQLLAAASGNTINVLDVETGSVQFNLKGHIKEVQSICWDKSGKYIASVSEDRIRVWSALSGGECVHELCSSDNKFKSCTFHPRYSLLLLIGGYQSLELWNPMSTCKARSFPAHDGVITALTNSLCTEMVASASLDGCVKLWK